MEYDANIISAVHFEHFVMDLEKALKDGWEIIPDTSMTAAFFYSVTVKKYKEPSQAGMLLGDVKKAGRPKNAPSAH